LNLAYKVRGIAGLRQAVADSIFIIAGDEQFKTYREAYAASRDTEEDKSDTFLNDPVVGYINFIGSVIAIIRFEWAIYPHLFGAIHPLLSGR
jgi:hypothetical protein